MRILLLSLATIFLSLSAWSQLTISNESSGEDLNGQVYVVEGSPNIFEMEHVFVVTNNSNNTYNVGCRRIEINAQAGLGMESTICWQICPAYVDVGEMEVRVSLFNKDMEPGDEDSSFAMHLRPNGNDGCTTYRIEWFNTDDETEVLGSVDMVFDHSVGECTTAVDEFANLQTTLSPNPASDMTSLVVDGIDQTVNIQIYDLLGQAISNEQFNPANANRYMIDTNSIGNGIYFVSIQSDNEVLKTIKMVVKH